jgi:type IV secretion system protein VirB6
MMACTVPETGGAFLSGILAHIDCQAQAIGAQGYIALAAPGSAVSIVLTALLTVFVAVIAIRMLVGDVPALGESMTVSLRIGVVLLLATSWAAYRVVAYDLVLLGPSELFGLIGSPADLPGSQGELVGRLQAADNGFVELARVGTGRFDLESGVPGAPSSGIVSIPFSDDLGFGLARIAFLAGTISAFGIVRLTAGLLLALAPLFAGALLFTATRGFFLGWLKMLVAAMLGALAVSAIVSVELALLEPYLTDTLARRAAQIATPAAPVELLVLNLAFFAILFALIAFSSRIAFAAAMPALDRIRQTGQRASRSFGASERNPGALRPDRDTSQGRSAQVVDALMQRTASEQRSITMREGAAMQALSTSVGGTTNRSTTSDERMQPIGQRFRRTSGRSSAASAGRDRRK